MPLKNPKALVATVRKLRSGIFVAHACDREPDGEDARLSADDIERDRRSGLQPVCLSDLRTGISHAA